jgi:hypothetical protein
LLTENQRLFDQLAAVSDCRSRLQQRLSAVVDISSVKLDPAPDASFQAKIDALLTQPSLLRGDDPSDASDQSELSDFETLDLWLTHFAVFSHHLSVGLSHATSLVSQSFRLLESESASPDEAPLGALVRAYQLPAELPKSGDPELDRVCNEKFALLRDWSRENAATPAHVSRRLVARRDAIARHISLVQENERLRESIGKKDQDLRLSQDACQKEKAEKDRLEAKLRQMREARNSEFELVRQRMEQKLAKVAEIHRLEVQALLDAE